MFAAFFAVFRICPLQKNKVFFVATHDDSEEGNAGIVAGEIRKALPEKKLVFLTRRDGIRHPLRFFIGKAFHMATAGTIFMDNHFMPMVYTPISKRAKVVQLWHGTGTIKKFGLDAESGELARLARRANQRTTHLIVGSERARRQYRSAFGIPEEKIYVIGLPRTDRMLDEPWMEERRRRFFTRYPQLENRRRILYAPTFRDEEAENPHIALDLEKVAGQLSDDEVMMLRLHPHVAGNIGKTGLSEYAGKIVDVSGYPGVATLLAVADVLVTDYSSIIFEYCLREKPMCFYAYDLESFREKGRGFYEDYESFVPGPVVRTQEELMSFLAERPQGTQDVSLFTRENVACRDKKSVERLLHLIFS